MLLNFKRNFTYLSCGAHSLRCSFERSFRQPTSCCSTPTPSPLPLAAAATLSKLATGHAWRLHQGDFFASPPQFCVSSAASSFALAIFNNSSEFRWLVGGGGKSLSSAFDVNLRSHSGLFASLPLPLPQSQLS